MRLLVKKLSRGMLESVVREELQSPNICVKGSCSSDPAVATRTPPSCSWPNMVARPTGRDWGKALRLPYWNADRVRGRKLDL